MTNANEAEIVRLIFKLTMYQSEKARPLGVKNVASYLTEKVHVLVRSTAREQ